LDLVQTELGFNKIQCDAEMEATMNDLIARDLVFQSQIQSLNANVAAANSSIESANTYIEDLTAQCNETIGEANS